MLLPAALAAAAPGDDDGGGDAAAAADGDDAGDADGGGDADDGDDDGVASVLACHLTRVSLLGDCARAHKWQWSTCFLAVGVFCWGVF